MASGVGAARLRATAAAAEQAERWLLGAQLWALSSAAGGNSEGLREAWHALQRAADGSADAMALEADVIRTLILKRGGLRINSAEYLAANARLDALLSSTLCSVSLLRLRVYPCVCAAPAAPALTRSAAHSGAPAAPCATMPGSRCSR